MRFHEFLATLDPPQGGSYKADRRARRDGKPRDPLCTPSKRKLAERTVAQAETQLSAAAGTPVELDYSQKVWPKAIAKLVSMGEADWRALKRKDQILPKAARRSE